MADSTPKPIHSLVLDTGPIIKNDPPISTLLAQAETLYTIPAVIDEIRDAVTRSRVESTLLPFLKLRAPRPTSVKVITDFARRTGDLEVLSRPDIHLMALAYELEVEENGGDWRLRRVPGQKELNGKKPREKEEKNGVIGEDAQKSKPVLVEAPVPQGVGAWGTAKPVATEEESTAVLVSGIEDALENAHLSKEPGSAESQHEIQPEAPKVEEPLQPKIETPVEEADSEDSEEDDDAGEWITPANLKKHQEKDGGGDAATKAPQKMQVAILTTDFAMQNVLLRMNINLISSGLQRIKQLKSWVLRCHACFHVTKDMGKQFCGQCGKPTLLRVSCSTKADGSFKLHLKKNMQWNTRGNVYSIPKAVAGTSNGKLVSGGGKGGWGQSLILAEDQKEYVQAMTNAKRIKEKDLMDEDYLPGLLSGDRGRAGGRPKVGAGRNVNSKKRH